MICPNCQHPNTVTAKFCENCGFKLQAAAPTSPAPAESDPALARLQKLVPREFAQRLLQSRTGQVERERRIVTILFCDVKGSTALGADRDPEEILEIMDGAFDILIEPVYRYEGTLARLMGDAILAFFGAPIAHEDDPERACLAALAIQERMAEYAVELNRTRSIENFGVRVGINTGLVVVGEVGSDLRVEYTAMGDAINIAARMEQSAEPGTIVIAENTARRVQHVFELEPLGARMLKGRSEPVSAYRVIGRKAAPVSARGIAGLDSPLVGRDQELSMLNQRLAELASSKGGIAAVIGEAGLGKSRLIAELRKRSRSGDNPNADQAAIQWLEGRSLSYETNTPFAPFIELLTRYFELAPADTDLERYAKLHARIQALRPGQADEAAPFIATLMGIELIDEPLERVRYLEPPILRLQLIAHALTLFERIAIVQPTLLVFEDLHWADASSLELIEQLLPLTERAPLMIMFLMRPNRQDPAWRLHETASTRFAARYTPVLLEPLGEQETRQLVANLLQIEDLPESVRALILKKAEGNPFYVEEVIRSLLDQKLVVRDNSHWRATREIVNIAIPDTLAGVITARLDRLDEDARRTAQTAAVIGREFSTDVLVNVSEAPQALPPALETLQMREIVREKGRAPDAAARPDRQESQSKPRAIASPQTAYIFKHALTQETAYNTLLKSRRSALHLRVAEYLERAAPDLVNDIARHFVESGASGRALPYLLAAGDRAARAYSSAEAVRYFNQAVEIAKAGNNVELARRAFEGLGSALSFANRLEDAVTAYTEMDDWAEAHNDAPMQISALNKLSSIIALRLGQFPDAEARLVKAEKLARTANDRQGLAELFLIRCQMCTAVADFDGAVRYMGEAVNIGREIGVKEQMALGLDHVSGTQLLMTKYDEAYQTAQEGLALSIEIGNREHQAGIENTLAYYYIREGDYDRAAEYAGASRRTAAEIGVQMLAILDDWALGWIGWDRGEYEQALAVLERGRETALPLEAFTPWLSVQVHAPLAGVYAEISPALISRAEQYRAHTLKLLENPAAVPAGGSAWGDLGSVALALNDLAQAEELFNLALNTPSIVQLVMKPRNLLGLAQAALRRDDLDTAQTRLDEARAFAEERRIKNWYPLIALTDGQLAAARGKAERALDQYTRAESFAGEMNMRPIIWQARAGAADLLARRGRTAEANAKRAAAHAMLDEIASLFRDASLKEAFLANALPRLGAG